jgi:hypothetical protein
MKPTQLVFALAVSLAFVATAHAQSCATGAQLNSNNFVCVTPAGSGDCNVNTPMGPGYTTFVQGSTVCCGQTMVSFFYGPPYLCQEQGLLLRDPGLLKAAIHAELETGEQFLVADCRGNLVPFEPSPQPSFAINATGRIELR